MKKIGIIGGMSYESTLHYYERINHIINDKLGNLSTAEIIMYSVNFQDIEPYMKQNRWEIIENELLDKAKKLESIGADIIIIATNTMHKLADYIQNQISIPILHIADCVAQDCLKQNITKLGLIGTKYTMTEDFLIKRLEKNGLTVYTPKIEKNIYELDRIIFEELCIGKIIPNSKKYYIEVITKMIKEFGINGIILGCTEIEMLVQQEDLQIPIFDTTTSHINATVNYILKNYN